MEAFENAAPGVTRRALLQSGGAVAAAGLAVDIAGPGPGVIEWLAGGLGPEAATPDLVKDVVRRDDLLSLRFEFFNLKWVTGGSVGPRLVRIVSTRDAYVVVGFAAQNIAERSFFEAAKASESSEVLPTPPIVNRLSGTSRLAFTVRADVLFIRYTLPGLLAWHEWGIQRVVPAALPHDVFPRPGFEPVLRLPDNTETALELPYRLIVSPSYRAGWAHAAAPVTVDGRTELWHTRLGTRVEPAGGPAVDEVAGEHRTVRAVWALPSYDKNTVPPKETGGSVPFEPFRTSLRANDRYQIVRLSADYSEDYTPKPADVNRMMLTSLGAYLDARGAWDLDEFNDEPLPPNDFKFDLTEWRHKMALGRDTYVRVVNIGSLCGLRHPAAYIEVTERKFQPVQQGAQTGRIGAFLRKRKFIMPRRPVVRYPDGPQPNGGRDWPFVEARITTLVTPNLDPTTHPESAISGFNEEEVFWPVVNGKPFRFHVVLTDRDGQVSECTLPLIYVSASIMQNKSKMDTLVAEYLTNVARQDRRRFDFHGQRVALAQSTKPGDTTLEVQRITLGAQTSAAPIAVNTPRFWPLLDSAEARLQAVEQIKGGGVGTATVKIHNAYVTNADNPSGLFAKLVNPVGVAFDENNGAASTGALVTPNLDITALSRLGPVGGDNTDIPPAEFDPEEFFADAKLFGIISLAQVIAKAPFSDQAKVPKIHSRTFYPGDNPKLPPTRTETTLEWAPGLQPAPSADNPIFKPNAGASFTVVARSVVPLDPPGEPSVRVVAEITNFTVNLVGTDPKTQCLRLDFRKVRFDAEKGKKTRVEVDLAGVRFLNALAFVEKLQDLLPSNDGSGPSIELTPQEVRACVGIQVPNVTAGLLNLYNLAFSGCVVLPFDGTPVRVSFAFCKKEAPFVLAYTIFGGGGYAEIELDVQGVKQVLVSLQAGVYAEMDFGIASGSISAAIGMELALAGNEVKLIGFFRAHGEVEAFGIVTVSIGIDLSFTYDSSDKSVYGQAELCIEVDLTLISVEGCVTVKKRIAGGGGGSGPSALALGPAAVTAIGFADLMDPADWNAYAADYAPAAFG